ncbi:hypothetical protein D3C72_179180 [compost metagenome]
MSDNLNGFEANDRSLAASVGAAPFDEKVTASTEAMLVPFRIPTKAEAEAESVPFTMPGAGAVPKVPQDALDVSTLIGSPPDEDEDEGPTQVIDNYKSTSKGVFIDTTGNGNWEQVCSPLEVVGISRNENGNARGRMVRLIDDDGRSKELAIQMQYFAGNPAEVLAPLLDRGLVIMPGKNRDVISYILRAKPTARMLCVDRIGWHGDVFVLPDATIGQVDGERVILQTDPNLQHTMGQAGTLKEWQDEVGSKAAGNSRLGLAISSAFAAPLLGILDEDGGGFHFRGTSSTGKTTALRVGGSVWGGGRRGYVRGWRATSNGLEGVAALHNHSLLCLDELGQGNPREAGEAVYMLGNGQGKQRANKSGSARLSVAWSLLFLSTGEKRLADLMALAGQEIKAGQEIRMADIPADAGAGFGLYEDLHGAESGDAFARQLNEATTRYYGTPIRAYLAWLVDNRETATNVVKDVRSRFVEAHVSGKVSGEVSRVAGRFGLVAAGGELARIAGVVPWAEGEAERAASICFNAWLSQRPGDGASDVVQAIGKIRDFVARNLGRFQYISSEASVPNCAGYRDEKDGVMSFYFIPSTLREVCGSVDHKLVLHELEARKHFMRGSEAGKLTTKLSVKNLGRLNVYHILGSILEDSQ